MSSNPVPHCSPNDFRRACACFATGVTVVTVCDRENRPQGFTANSFTSVSLDPPLVLVCVDLRARILDSLQEGTFFNINILNESQEHLSAQFASALDDRFSGVAWKLSPGGTPHLEGSLALLECCVERVLAEGDHAIVVGRVLNTALHDGAPLVYFRSAYRSLRGEPATVARERAGENGSSPTGD